MVFLDETGRRWRRIKLGTGLLSSGVAMVVITLIGASFLYLPSWGFINLPKALGINTTAQSVGTTQTTAPLQAAGQNSSGSSGSTNSPFLSVGSNSPAAQSGTTTATPATTATSPSSTTTTPTTTSTQPTITPTQPGLGLAKKTTVPGNSDYGQSHQPTHS